MYTQNAYVLHYNTIKVLITNQCNLKFNKIFIYRFYASKNGNPSYDLSVIYNSRTFHHISHISTVVVSASVYVENLPEAFSDFLVQDLTDN